MKSAKSKGTVPTEITKQKSRSSYAQLGQKLGKRLFSVMAPRADVMIFSEITNSSR